MIFRQEDALRGVLRFFLRYFFTVKRKFWCLIFFRHHAIPFRDIQSRNDIDIRYRKMSTTSSWSDDDIIKFTHSGLDRQPRLDDRSSEEDSDSKNRGDRKINKKNYREDRRNVSQNAKQSQHRKNNRSPTSGNRSLKRLRDVFESPIKNVDTRDRASSEEENKITNKRRKTSPEHKSNVIPNRGGPDFNAPGKNFNKTKKITQDDSDPATTPNFNASTTTTATNLVAPTDEDFKNVGQVLFKQYVNHELGSLVDNVKSVDDLSDRLYMQRDILKKHKMKTHAITNTKGAEYIDRFSKFTDGDVVEHDDSAIKHLPRSSEECDDRLFESVAEKTQSSLTLKLAKQSTFIDKYDVRFIASSDDVDQVNLAFAVIHDAPLPHILDIILQDGCKIQHENTFRQNRKSPNQRITKTIRIVDTDTYRPSVLESIDDVSSERLGRNSGKIVTDYNYDHLSRPKNYEQPINNVITFSRMTKDIELYETFGAQYRINVDYHKQLCWMSTTTLFKLVKRYAKEKPQKSTEYEHCLFVCYIFNTYFKKRTNYEIKLKNFIDIIKFKLRILKEASKSIDVSDDMLPSCLKFIDATHVSNIITNVKIDKNILKNLQCITNECLFDCWTPFSKYEKHFKNYASFVHFFDRMTEEEESTFVAENKTASSDVGYFKVFKSIVSFEKNKIWMPSELCRARSKMDGPDGTSQTIYNSLGDFIIQLLNQLPYKSTQPDSEANYAICENDAVGDGRKHRLSKLFSKSNDSNFSEYHDNINHKIDRNESRKEGESNRHNAMQTFEGDKTVYDGAIWKMFKEASELHLKYSREISRISGTGSNIDKFKKNTKQADKETTKSTTNQVQVQVVNTPYVINNGTPNQSSAQIATDVKSKSL